MDETELVILRDAAVGLIRRCDDEDLLDLVCKLLMECGVKEPQPSLLDVLE